MCKRNHKVVLIGLVIDGTLSFTTAYAQVYYLLAQLAAKLKNRGDSEATVTYRYSVMVLHDEPETPILAEDEDALLEILRNIRFYGGSSDGREGITQAIEAQLRAFGQMMAEAPEDEVSRMLFVFSDAEDASGQDYPDFTGYPAGLSLAGFYTYSDSYMPMMKMVNSKGLLQENGVNTCRFESLRDLIDLDESQMIQYADDLAAEIMAAAGGCDGIK